MLHAPRFSRFARPASVAAVSVLAAFAVSAPASASADELLESATQAESPLVGLPRGVFPMRRFTPNTPQMSSQVELPTTCKLSYNGGPVISNVKVVIVYWGAGVDASLQAFAPGFFQAILSSTYMDWLQEYNTPAGTGTGQTICRGSYVNAVTITPSSSSKTVADADIGPELAAQMAAGKVPVPSLDATGHSNTLYFLYFAPGVTITQGGASSCVQFCGYHGDGAYQGKSFPYAVIPDLGGGCANGCGGGTKNENFGVVSSHELIEAITDTGVGDNDIAWYQQGSGACNGEIGDICAAASGDTAVVNGYKVQLEWSNKQKKCVASGVGYTPCGGCTTNANCAAPTPACKTATGGCVGCLTNTDCSGATPTCDTTSNTCKACSADADCPGAHCATTGTNIGKCVACTTNAQCANPTPVCTVAAGTCGGCKADADCAGNAAGTTCNTATGACGAKPSGSSSGSSGSSSGSSGTSGGSSGGTSGGADGGASSSGNSADPTSDGSTTTTSGCAMTSSSDSSTGSGAALALVAGLALAIRNRRRKQD